jgi:acetyl esterase/lipase
MADETTPTPSAAEQNLPNSLDNFGIPPMMHCAAPAQDGAVPLYPQLEDGEIREIWLRTGGRHLVRNVSQPSIMPVLPDPEIATGASVIVAPGGAFMLLAIEHEGWMVASELAARGIAAFVLKYRTSPTPEDPEAFNADLRERMGKVIAHTHAGGAAQVMQPQPVEDALAAVQLVRSGASRWRLDPARVGILGFSAGAMVAVEAATASQAVDRPDFVAAFYPSLSARPTPADAPPLFAAIAFDDLYFGRQDLGLIEGWRRAGRPVEFHGYASGGHGFGLGRAGTPTALVFDQLLLWMRSQGLLRKEAR